MYLISVTTGAVSIYHQSQATDGSRDQSFSLVPKKLPNTTYFGGLVNNEDKYQSKHMQVKLTKTNLTRLRGVNKSHMVVLCNTQVLH